jgi:hypothetical protein
MSVKIISELDQQKSLILSERWGSDAARRFSSVDINRRWTSQEQRPAERTPPRALKPYTQTAFGPFSLESHEGGRIHICSLQFPRWPLRGKLEFDLRMSLSRGLQSFGFRCYNTLENESLVFTYVRHGNLEGMLRLFDTGFASPLDIDEQGWTLLHVRCLHAVPSDEAKI